MTQDDRTLVRQVEVWARFNQKACEFDAKGDSDTQRGRPFFIIDTALHGCGYKPCTTDWARWNVVVRWMYGTDNAREHTGPSTRDCEDPSCGKRG